MSGGLTGIASLKLQPADVYNYYTSRPPENVVHRVDHIF